MKRLRIGLTPCVLLLAAAATALASPSWVLLGERTVTDRLDHDLIAVTADRGEFSAVKLTVRRHKIDFHRFIIHFANGDKQVIEVRRSIPAGGESRAVDLDGGRRVIQSIEFWYDAHTVRGKLGLVQAYGLR
jgi:hypothetical protein